MSPFHDDHLKGTWLYDHLTPEGRQARYTLTVSREPLLILRALAVLDEEAKSMLLAAVAEAREQGATWEQIGTALGVTRQAAQARFSVTRPR